MMAWISLGVMLSLVAAQAPVVLDRVLASVGGQLITLSDLRTARGLRLVDGPDEPALLGVMIERRLVLDELRRFQVADPEPALVEGRLNGWAASLGRPRDQALEAADVPLEFVRRWLADDLRREAYVRQRFAALEPERRAEAERQWIDGLRNRTDVVIRVQRF
jgi:hypothetical protein